jgi:predicted Rdx family selenoprotein
MRLWQRERDGGNNKNKEGVERVRDGWMERVGERECD